MLPLGARGRASCSRRRVTRNTSSVVRACRVTPRVRKERVLRPATDTTQALMNHDTGSYTPGRGRGEGEGRKGVRVGWHGGMRSGNVGYWPFLRRLIVPYREARHLATSTGGSRSSRTGYVCC